MEGRPPHGPKGKRWGERVWSTGVDDPRGHAQYHPSIDQGMVAGIVYALLGLAIVLLL